MANKPVLNRKILSIGNLYKRQCFNLTITAINLNVLQTENTNIQNHKQYLIIYKDYLLSFINYSIYSVDEY